MSNLFYRHGRLLVLALALILVAGVSALEVLPRSEDPELVSRNALVVTSYPGADAARVESQVTEKIEDELDEVDEIALLESLSRAGTSIVSIELSEAIDETAEVWSRVRDRLDDARAELPSGAGEPDFEQLTITAWSLHTALIWEREDPPNYAILGRLAEELERELRGLPGTEEVEIFGAPAEEIRIEVEAARLPALGLSAERLAHELERGDAKVPAGRLDSQASELLVEVAGELDGLERIARVPVTQGPGGTLVRLGGIATIERGVSDPPGELALVAGRPAVLVAARMHSSDRIDRWADRAHAVLKEASLRMPAGVALDIVFDQSGYTEERLEDLIANLALGALLVVGVILFMMGWRSALLVGAALPLSSLMVLAGMRGLGIPMHQMSVTGLIIALGLLIDNAIVMVDEVNHRLDQGQGIAVAISGAVRTLVVPLSASTATTVLAFLPLVLAQGSVGEFVGAMSVSVVLAVTSSFLLSLTIIPALTGWMQRLGRGRRQGTVLHGVASAGLSSARLSAAYTRVLGLIFRHPVIALALALLLPLFGFWKGSELQEQFFPPAGRDQAAIELTLPDSYSIDRTLEEVRRADTTLREHPRVVTSHWVLGRSAPKFYYNQMEGVENDASFAGGMVELDRAEGAVEVLQELQASLDRALPGAMVLVRQLEQGPPFDAPIELILEGPELEVLNERGEALRALLTRVPDVIHTRASLAIGRPKLLFTPSDDELERVGLDRVGVAERLQAALSGAVGGSLVEGSEELPARVRLAPAARSSSDDVASLELARPTMQIGAAARPASWVPLDALGHFDLVPESSSIPRRNGQRTNEVHAFITAGRLPQDSLDVARSLLEDFELPTGYRLSFGGEAAERDEAVGSLAASAGILLVLMATVLVVSFHSFRMAGVIACVALLSVGLAMGALWTFGHPFGFMAIVGTMGLIGIAINDAIVVLAALHSNARAKGGDVSAVVQVVVRETRHVLATTVTTIAGFLPLLIGGGGLWPPLAVSIAGGVLGATLLALTFVPGAFVLLVRRTPSAFSTVT